MGHAAIEQFSLGMNMNMLSHSSYYAHLPAMSKQAMGFSTTILEDARNLVRFEHIKENPDLSDCSVIDISVSHDGTWHKRGHTSNYGVGCVIDILTGLVIDFEVISKYCHTCSLTEKTLGKESPEYAFWYEGH